MKLNQEICNLVEQALTARENSYSPYSQYAVGAAILMEGGDVITGCNVENASYGGCICAERVAAVRAVASGYKNFVALAIAGGCHAEDPAALREFAFPCGICRQFLNEFNKDLDIYVAKSREEVEYFRLSDLLPKAFGPDHL